MKYKGVLFHKHPLMFFIIFFTLIPNNPGVKYFTPLTRGERTDFKRRPLSIFIQELPPVRVQ